MRNGCYCQSNTLESYSQICLRLFPKIGKRQRCCAPSSRAHPGTAHGIGLISGGNGHCTPEELSDLVHSSLVRSTTVDVLPSTARLTSLDTVLPMATCREGILKEILHPVKDEYDYIFIDCNAGGDLFTVNALAASDSVLLPVEARPLGMEGLDQVEKLIQTVRRHLNPDLKIEGIILTKVQGRTNCCLRIRERIKTEFAGRIRVFEAEIKLSISVADAPDYGVSLHEYDPKCRYSTRQ